MASDKIAISVKGLGKKYSIGGPQEKYLTFRDAIVNSVKAPFKRFSAHEPPSEFWALMDVSFDVEQGEVVGIIGRNGAGKSTLLKILSRITAPTEGTVDLYGRVGSLLEVGTGFHPELTGRENIFLSGSILGMKRREIDAKLDEIVKFSEIEKFLDTPVKRYSSGMYVRLAFSVAAYMDTEILLVDEVLAVGDAAFQKKCLGKMGDVATKEGRTVLFVSHNMGAIKQLCRKAILLSDGQNIKNGDINSVIDYYLANISTGTQNLPVYYANSTSSLILKKIQLIDDKKNPVSFGQCGKELNLLVSMFSKITLNMISISIGINDNFNSRVTLLHSSIAGYDLSIEEGDNTFICKIPHLPLVPGNYILDFKIISKNDSVFWAPNVLKLTVESADFFNTGKLPDSEWAGVLLLEQDWSRTNGEES